MSFATGIDKHVQPCYNNCIMRNAHILLDEESDEIIKSIKSSFGMKSSSAAVRYALRIYDKITDDLFFLGHEEKASDVSDHDDL